MEKEIDIKIILILPLLLTLIFNFKIRQTNNFKFNQNANHLQNQLWLRSHCRTDPNNVDHVQFPFETENAKN
jgi:hypothetical protein